MPYPQQPGRNLVVFHAEDLYGGGNPLRAGKERSRHHDQQTALPVGSFRSAGPDHRGSREREGHLHPRRRVRGGAGAESARPSGAQSCHRRKCLS